MSNYPAWLREAASRGGKATGRKKLRGDSNYYRRLAKKAAKARKAKPSNARGQAQRPEAQPDHERNEQ